MITPEDLWAAHDAIDAIEYGLNTVDDRIEDDPAADLWEIEDANDLIAAIRAVLPPRNMLPERRHQDETRQIDNPGSRTVGYSQVYLVRREADDPSE